MAMHSLQPLLSGQMDSTRVQDCCGELLGETRQMSKTTYLGNTRLVNMCIGPTSIGGLDSWPNRHERARHDMRSLL